MSKNEQILWNMKRGPKITFMLIYRGLIWSNDLCVWWDVVSNLWWGCTELHNNFAISLISEQTLIKNLRNQSLGWNKQIVTSPTKRRLITLLKVDKQTMRYTMLQSNTPPKNEQHTFFGCHCTLIKQPCHQYKTDPFQLSFSKHSVGVEGDSWHGRHCTLLYVYHMSPPCQCQQVKAVSTP